MCIRDRFRVGGEVAVPQMFIDAFAASLACAESDPAFAAEAVSYTHLTLPTSDLV